MRNTRALSTQLKIPVVEDEGLGMNVTFPFRPDLGIGSAFSFNFEDAIQATERHVYIQDEPPNPIAFVEGWLNLLRWEMSYLWKIDKTTNRYFHNKDLCLTPEHYKRSGELIAEGIAVIYLEEKLKVPRQRFFFYKGSGARPDYIVNLSTRHKRALLYRGNKLGIEVRSREGVCRKIPATDRKDLRKKKTNPGVGGTLAVYCYYGNGSHRDGTSKTRIQLADPPGENTAATELDIAGTVVNHYLTTTSHIGLWDHRNHLKRSAAIIQRGELPTIRMDSNSNKIGRGCRKVFRNVEYRGREFNELVAMAQQDFTSVEEKRATRDEIARRFDYKAYGDVVFRGINTKVLELIEQNRWFELSDFKEQGAGEIEPNTVVRTDGQVRRSIEIRPDSQEYQELDTQLRGFLESKI